MIDSLHKLAGVMSGNKPLRLYAKRLAPNDNSKNQVYLGGGFTVLNIIPHGNVQADGSKQAGSVRDRAKAAVNFSWVDETGSYPAPNTQLILYPKYPEVRMSGFLLGCRNAPSEVMRSRIADRILFLGVLPDDSVLGFAVFPEHPLAQKIEALENHVEVGVFWDLTSAATGKADTKQRLLQALRKIHEKSWINSQKIGAQGVPMPYSARKGGGYTLEAELGISPNGYADPDYLGWEVKQYGVNSFVTNRAKGPITLMTPEPTSGEYKDSGVAEFLRRYGYPDRSGIDDRINFGGVYRIGQEFHNLTGLALKMSGFDPDTGKITDMEGSIQLVSRSGSIAAAWNFSGIMDHWNRKHARAVYVPSMSRKNPPQYSFGNIVTLCEETDFILFLGAIAAGRLYYDPGIKMESAGSDSPKIKRRSQFRIKQIELRDLYAETEDYDLSTG
jgi:hypothetical protein